jgi:penicillin-binding protein 2
MEGWVDSLWIVDWATAISDPGYFHLPGDSHKFRDWKKTGHGIVNMHKAIRVSCDTYFYILSIKWVSIK